MNGTEIRSLNECLDLVRDLEAGGAGLGGFLLDRFWYRGQVEHNHVAPGVGREDFLKKAKDYQNCNLCHSRPYRLEVAINQDFRRLSSPHLHPGLAIVDLYFLAQHHGLPTRLLDWSKSPLVALFFAVGGGDSNAPEVGLIDCRDGWLWILDRHEAQKSATSSLMPQDDDRLRVAVEWLFGGQTPPGLAGVVQVLPNLHTARMERQAACFTLHLPGAQPLGSQRPGLYVWRIPAAAKRSIMDELRRAGVTASALFPDLDHVSEDIWRFHTRELEHRLDEERVSS